MYAFICPTSKDLDQSTHPRSLSLTFIFSSQLSWEVLEGKASHKISIHEDLLCFPFVSSGFAPLGSSIPRGSLKCVNSADQKYNSNSRHPNKYANAGA